MRSYGTDAYMHTYGMRRAPNGLTQLQIPNKTNDKDDCSQLITTYR